MKWGKNKMSIMQILNLIFFIIGMYIIMFFILLAIILSISWYKTMIEYRVHIVDEFNKNNRKSLIKKFIKIYLSNMLQITALFLTI